MQSIPNEKTFDFFGLPREIRDMLFEEMLLDQEELSWESDGLNIRLQYVPQKNHQLTSREFRRELQAKAATLTHLLVEVNRVYLGGGPDLPLPLAHMVSRVEVHQRLICPHQGWYTGSWRLPTELTMYSSVLRFITGLPNARSLTLHLYLHIPSDSEECGIELSALRAKFTSCLANRVRELAVNVYNFDDGRCDFSGPKTLVMKYSSHTRGFHRVAKDGVMDELKGCTESP